MTLISPCMAFSTPAPSSECRRLARGHGNLTGHRAALALPAAFGTIKKGTWSPLRSLW